MDSRGTCQEGLDAEKTGHLPALTAAIGVNVAITVPVGRGHDTTHHSFFSVPDLRFPLGAVH